jgi:hypothetical protein
MRIVVYDYYGQAVYVDGKLAGYYGHNNDFDVAELCGQLGISFEKRSVRWEDWPGLKENMRAVYDPPVKLETVEQHFAELNRRRKVDRLEQLKMEVAKLEQELSH